MGSMTTRQVIFYGYEQSIHKQTPYICRQDDLLSSP
jgi:hypothetical protein